MRSAWANPPLGFGGYFDYSDPVIQSEPYAYTYEEIDNALKEIGYSPAARYYAIIGATLAGFVGVRSAYELSQGQDVWSARQLTTLDKVGRVVDVGLTASAVTGTVKGVLNAGAVSKFPAASAATISESAVPSQLSAGTAYEAQRLAQLGKTKSTITWRPTEADIDSSAFKVIVGDAKYTRSGLAKGTIFDASVGGLLEIKSGKSLLNSSYQLRLQTYYSLKSGVTYTIETARPINPTFQAWLDRWGVVVQPPK